MGFTGDGQISSDEFVTYYVKQCEKAAAPSGLVETQQHSTDRGARAKAVKGGLSSAAEAEGLAPFLERREERRRAAEARIAEKKAEQEARSALDAQMAQLKARKAELEARKAEEARKAQEAQDDADDIHDFDNM